MAQDVNLNATECVVTKTHFGYDTITNVCSGKITELQWAFGDWMGLAAMAFLALIFTAILAMVVFMIVQIARD